MIDTVNGYSGGLYVFFQDMPPILSVWDAIHVEKR